MMDRDERARLRALAEAATPGGWYVEAHGIMDATRFRTIVMVGESDQDDADAAFIAASRTAIPALLDALDAVEAERDEAVGLLRRVKADRPSAHTDALWGDLCEFLARLGSLSGEEER